MKKKNRLLPLDLQLFADENPPADPPSDQTPPADDSPADTPPKTYTEEQVQEMVKQRVAREKKAAEKAVAEAKKLAKMNEEQKKEYEFEQLQKKLADYEKKEAFYELSKEATKMLSEHEIIADDELLAFVVKDSAEDTQAAVNSFVSLVNSKVEEGVKKALAGKPPKVNQNSGKTLTKAQIFAEKDAIKRQKLIHENMNLFN